MALRRVAHWRTMRRRGWRLTASLAAAAILALAGGGVSGQQAAATAVSCAAEVEAARRRWHVVEPPLLQPPLTPGDSLRHWPTTTLGAWVVDDTSAGHATLTRVDPATLTRMSWTADCTVTTTSRPRPAAPPPAFADADLARLLATGGSGVLYLWSPHMPLSVDGYATLVAATRARGLALEPLLDPAADRAFASREATARRLPAAALRVADAVELQFRELALHAPSAAVFAGGRLIGSVLRGYRTAEEYTAYFDRELGRR